MEKPEKPGVRPTHPEPEHHGGSGSVAAQETRHDAILTCAFAYFGTGNPPSLA